MKEVNKEVLKDAADRLLFSMKESEYDTLLEEFKVLKLQTEKMGKIEGLENYQPMTFPFDCETSYLRDDVPGKPLTRDEALRNAGSKQDNQVKLPKVVK